MKWIAEMNRVSQSTWIRDLTEGDESLPGSYIMNVALDPGQAKNHPNSELFNNQKSSPGAPFWDSTTLGACSKIVDSQCSSELSEW